MSDKTSYFYERRELPAAALDKARERWGVAYTARNEIRASLERELGVNLLETGQIPQSAAELPTEVRPESTTPIAATAIDAATLEERQNMERLASIRENVSREAA